MTNDTRMDLVKKMFEEFVTKGSAELLFQVLAEGVIWRTTAPVGTPLHGEFRGRDGVAEYFRRSGELVEILDPAVTDFLQSADRIVVLGSERLRLRRTGQEQSLEWATVMSFEGDRISTVLVMEDLSLLLAAA